MASNTLLISGEWKHSLETTPDSSVTSLVSLYDLLYDDKGQFWAAHADSTAGTALNHDIICLNKSMLMSGTGKIQFSAGMQDSIWWTYGIDISLPKYDTRAKHKWYQNKAQLKSTVAEDYIFNGNGYYIYDKDSALPPENITIFTVNGVRTGGLTIQSPDESTYLPPSIGTNGGNGDRPQSDIILSSEDTVFKSTLVTQDGMYAYNRIYLNPWSVYTQALICKAIGLKDNRILGTSAHNFIQISTDTVATSLNADVTASEAFWVRGKPYSIIDAINCGDDLSIYLGKIESSPNYQADRFTNILKNTYVWVRAPFFADYIKPESFNQDLNTDSQVVHSELMLTGAGDFKKYDQYLQQGAYITNNTSFSDTGYNPANSVTSHADLTLPYIPRTSPTVDFYTSDFLDSRLSSIKKVSNDRNKNYSSTLQESLGNKITTFLEDNVSENNPVIKGLPIAAINRNDARDGRLKNNLTPPGWFDPESRYDETDYGEMGKFPTILPTKGNLYVDGRIISPSIDELWYMVKKLIAGRPSDVDELSNSRLDELSTGDIGIPFGYSETARNNTDTTMTEVPNAEFKFGYEDSTTRNKVGDPINFEYSGTEDNKKLRITKFVNQNDSIVYPLFKSLKVISDSITQFQKDDDDKIGKVGNREIFNFTAWNTNTEAVDDGDVIHQNEAITTGVWAPRKVPYSLRELEAMVMSNKYNLITEARFVKENFAVTGQLGKVNGFDADDMSNFAAGSLYQMHKNYNFNVSDPNTFYDATGTDSGIDPTGKIVGAKAVIDDLDLRTSQQISEGHIRFAETYGTSKYLSTNQEMYSSADVYMSAAGDWRYVSDHNRIPCLRAEF